MMLTVYCVRRDRSEITFSLQVSAELELRDFVALCELESGIPAAEIQITHAEQPLGDLARTLGSYGLKDGDVVVLRQAERRPPVQPAFPGLPRIDFSSIAVPGTSSTRQLPAQQLRSPPPPAPPSLHPGASPQGLDDPALLRDMLLANPHELSLLKERNPPLAEALLSGDLERFTKVLLEQQQERARREQERIRLLTADPFDLEAQAKIEEDIRQHNIEENMTIAMEEAPESFGQVVMLYINCKVNGHPVKAFVDSGAQMTIMSQACAERCNIMRLVDRRWAGIAKGVGTQKIIGRVHLAQVQIEGDFLPCSFSILEDQPMDMLLGLDMLKRHQCSIDLKKNVLLIGTTGSETRFLPEAELPECARLAYGAGREEVQPQEIADRELAEALQRSVQESDTEDGRTTSPKPPLYPAPAASCPPHGQTLDRSVSAPDPLIPLQPAQRLSPSAAERSQSEPQFQGLPAATAGLPADPPVTAVGQDTSGEPIHTPSPPALQLGTPAALEVIPGWDVSTGSINLEESLSSFPDKSPQASEEISLADGDLVPDLQPSREPVDLESLQTGSVPATSVTVDPQCQSNMQNKEDVLSERQSEVGTSEDMVGKLRLLSQNLGSRSFTEKPDLKSGSPSNILEVGLRKDFGGTQGESMALEGLSDCKTQSDSLDMDLQGSRGPDLPEESLDMELQGSSGPDTQQESVGMELQALSGPDTQQESVGMELQALSGPDTQQESVGMELQALSGPDTWRKSVGMEPQALSGPDTQRESVGIELQALSGPDTQRESVGIELQGSSGPDTQQESVGMELQAFSGPDTQRESVGMELQGSSGPDTQQESVGIEPQALSGPDTQRESVGMELQGSSGPDTQQESVGIEPQALSGPDTRQESVGMELQAFSGPDTQRESVGMELQGSSGPDTQQESVGIEPQALSGPDTWQESVGMELQAFSGPDTQRESVGMELQGSSGPDTQQESVGIEPQALSGPDTQRESVGMELQGSSGPGPQEDNMGMELEVADVELESNNRPTKDPELISSQECLSPILGIARPEDLTHENYDETSIGKMQELCGESPPDPSMVSLCPPPLTKNKPQGEKQGADNTHSLAAALLELHELLVASSRGASQDLTRGDSPVCQRQDADSSDVPVSWGQTCMEGGFLVNTETKASIAKPETAAAESPSPSPSPNLLSVKEQADRVQPAWVPEIEQGPSEMQTGQGSSGGESDVLEEKLLVSKDQECQLPGSGQLGRGVASGRASVPDALDSEMEVPLNAGAGPLVSGVSDGQSFPQVLFPSSGGAPLVSPAPQGVAATRPLHFPDAHIQRITSAGFTATEAVETLEQFQGNPELALLVLLARKIKVPT